MTVPVPNLDNRTFEQLLKEARISIPNYTPEWTNHNPADPGITFIELIAWLAEIASYRINLVTEEHLLKYLKLLGVRPKGSQPAITYLSLETQDIVVLEKGTVFLAEKNGEKIDFELLEDITINPIKLENIIANEVAVPLHQFSTSESQFNEPKNFPTYIPIIERPLKSQITGTCSVTTASIREKDSMLQENNTIYGIYDRSNQNENADLFFAPFGLNLKKNSELYLGFKPPDNLKNEISLESFNFWCYLYEKDLIDPGKHGEEAEFEYEFESARLKWEISISPEGKQWKEVIPKDGTRNFTKSGSILFTGLEGWVCSSINSYLSKNKRCWLRCTLLDSKYEYPPRIERIILNTAPVIQKKRLTDLMLGISSGLPGQVFKLPETPVIRGSLKMSLTGEWEEIENFHDLQLRNTNFTLESQNSQNSEIRLGEGSGILKLSIVEEWKEVERFDASKPESSHFVLESLKSEIRFGDGIKGKIPPKDTEIRVIEYETGNPPRIENIHLNTVPVIQKKRLTDLLLGISNGLPGQVFKLPETPVIKGSLKIAIVGEWKEVEDFDVSKPEDTHFTLESLKGEIRFGDGLRGKIPSKDTEIWVIRYETGRGERGNLPATSNWVVKEKDISGLKQDKTSNFKPATGGTNEESIDEAFERFIRDLRVPYRAVTSEDFEYIARKTPGLRVAQAKAIQNFNRRSNTEEKGTVTVVVVPFSPLDTFENPPEPSTGFINVVDKHLNKHRLLGTFVCVVPPDYIKVKVKVTLGISKGFSEAEIRKKVIGKLELFLHPIKGDFSGKGWPVGKDVYRSEIYQLITEIEGVDFVDKIEIFGSNEKPNKGDLKLLSTATIYSGEHSVEILRASNIENCRKMQIKR